MGKQFIRSVHNFRGIAIINIVLGHALVNQFLVTHPILTNLFTGGTALFVFISGYLFTYLLKSPFNYSDFIKKKFRIVITPYLICSIPLLVYLILTNNPSKAFGDVGTIEATLLSLITGRHVVAYWYIPFITLVFLTIPIQIRFLALGQRSQILILFSLSLVSMLIHRAANSINPIHSYFYYLPVFQFGMFYCTNQYWFEQKIHVNKEYFIFLVLAVLLAVFQFEIFGQVSNYRKPFSQILVYSGIDLMYPQKICLILFFFNFLKDFFLSNRIISFIATISFPIFFIHGYVREVLHKIIDINNFYISAAYPLFSTIIPFLVLILLSIFVGIVVKKLLGEKSKYVIGG